MTIFRRLFLVLPQTKSPPEGGLFRLYRMAGLLPRRAHDEAREQKYCEADEEEVNRAGQEVAGLYFRFPQRQHPIGPVDDGEEDVGHRLMKSSTMASA